MGHNVSVPRRTSLRLLAESHAEALRQRLQIAFCAHQQTLVTRIFSRRCRENGLGNEPTARVEVQRQRLEADDIEIISSLVTPLCLYRPAFSLVLLSLRQ